jgi:ribosomal protein S18 acetylase RimI-like enzyme
MAITLRAISTADKDLYRETRLRALQDTPFAFGSNYARELRLMVTGNNPSAMDFYLRNGFHPTGHTGPYPNDPAVFEHEMLCALSAP